MPQYRKVKFSNFTIVAKSKNNKCCLLSTEEIVVVENIVYCSNKNGYVIIGRKFLEKQDLYITPCSSSLLGIFHVNKLLMLKVWPKNYIIQKMFLYKIPNDDSFAVFPLGHTDQNEIQTY